MSEGIYRLRPVLTEFRARQWTPDTDPAELAEWCEGYVYTGTQHGHTSPPFAAHSCINPVDLVDGSKGHADPGDWIVEVARDPEEVWHIYEVLSPGEFAAKYESAVEQEGTS